MWSRSIKSSEQCSPLSIALTRLLNGSSWFVAASDGGFLDASPSTNDAQPAVINKAEARIARMLCLDTRLPDGSYHLVMAVIYWVLFEIVKSDAGPTAGFHQVL